jgi:hypothetical protein
MAQAGTYALRKFGLTVGTAFGVLGLLFWYFGRDASSTVALAVGAILVLLGVLLPLALAPVEGAWMALAMVLAWINTRLILTLLYYLVITPIGGLVRLRRDPLNRRLHDGSPSYWIRRDPKTRDRVLYERQF